MRHRPPANGQRIPVPCQLAPTATKGFLRPGQRVLSDWAYILRRLIIPDVTCDAVSF